MWKLIGLRELTAGSVQLFRQAGSCWQWKYFVWTSSEVADEEIFDVRTPFFPQYRNYSGHDAAILRTKRDTGCVCPWSMSSTQYFLQALVSIFLFLISRHITSTSASENWHSSNTTRSILTDGVVKKLHPFDLHVLPILSLRRPITDAPGTELNRSPSLTIATGDYVPGMSIAYENLPL